jgi:hypothetical protein
MTTAFEEPLEPGWLATSFESARRELDDPEDKTKWVIRKLGPRWWRAEYEREDDSLTIDAPTFYILCAEIGQWP